MIAPRIWDKDRPDYWFGRHPIKWVDDDGDVHKSYVVPIKYLKTGHLVHILLKKTDREPDEVLKKQIENVRVEYQRRVGSM